MYRVVGKGGFLTLKGRSIYIEHTDKTTGSGEVDRTQLAQSIENGDSANWGDYRVITNEKEVEFVLDDDKKIVVRKDEILFALLNA